MDTGVLVLSEICKKSECWINEEDTCILSYNFNTEFSFLHIDLPFNLCYCVGLGF